jgi:aspartate aminotransferase-like enzyme
MLKSANRLVNQTAHSAPKVVFVKWFVPGPVPVRLDVQKAMDAEMISHRSQAFRELFAECTAALKRVFGTTGPVFSITGSGTLANEAAVANLLAGKKTLCLVNGEFGKRLGEACQIYNPKETKMLNIPDGKGINAERIQAELQAFTPEWVTIVHNETATGVTNDIQSVAALCKQKGAKILVDAVSSLGGLELKMDAWGIDACTSASQKSLAAPPGLGFVALSPAVMQEVSAKTFVPTFGLDLRRYKKFYDKNETPYTPSLPTFYGLLYALRELEADGLENRFAAHAKAAAIAQKAVLDAGFALFAEEGFQSNTITAFLTDRAIEIKKAIQAKGVEIAGGQGQWKGKMLRIATIGPEECDNIQLCADALLAACAEKTEVAVA